MTDAQKVRTLNEHCDRYGAGFYLTSQSYHGRAFRARVSKGVFQVLYRWPDSDNANWIAVGDDAKYWNHNGRPIGNLPCNR